MMPADVGWNHFGYGVQVKKAPMAMLFVAMYYAIIQLTGS
jgi:hypothetical protein